MSKAILVIDMPKNCEECILCRTENIYRCQLNYKRVNALEIPNWCALKILPISWENKLEMLGEQE